MVAAENNKAASHVRGAPRPPPNAEQFVASSQARGVAPSRRGSKLVISGSANSGLGVMTGTGEGAAACSPSGARHSFGGAHAR